MSDRWVVVMVAAAVAGALHPSSLPIALGVAVAAAALLVRAPVLLCVAVALCASALAARALDGLVGVTERDVVASVTLVSDPEPAPDGLRADARLGGRRVELLAGPSTAGALAPRLAGEVVDLRGALRPAPPDAPWLVARHVAGRMTVLSVEGWSEGDPASRLTNGLRRTLADGASPLSAVHRSLFTGLVVGDDRAQPAWLADDFLGAGMTHLLAVSGQNVAFCLVLAGPLLRRLRLWPRLFATLAVVALFGVMTRFEPSVLRASAMAALAATVITVGRPMARVRVIGLAATALLLVDPLLVHSVGFRLSLAAAAAIVVLARPITDALPGPAAVREALGVTLAAQLGVSPVLLATFGPMPVASIPANLLAVPVAGLVMVWGLTGGLLAGVLGGTAASLLHVPTRLALSWLELVAARAASAPLGELRWPHVLAIGAGLTVAAAATRSVNAGARNACSEVHRSWKVGGLGLGVVALVAAVLIAHAPPPLRSNPMVGLVLWHARGTDVVVLGGVGGRASLGARPVLEALRREGVGSIELLVVADSAVPESTLAAVAGAHRVGGVIADVAADEHSELRVTPQPVTETVVPVGSLMVRLVPLPDRLVVDARVPA